MEMEQVRQELKVLERNFMEMKNILNEVHSAIVGNPLSKDGGIVTRLSDAERQLDEMNIRFVKAEKRLEDKITENEKKQIRYNVMTAVMWASLGGVAAFIFTYFLHH